MGVCCCVAPSPFCSCYNGYIYNSMFPATHYRLPHRRISTHTDINTSSYQYINENTYPLSTSPNTYVSNSVDGNNEVDSHNKVNHQMSGGCRDKKPLLGEDVEVNTPLPPTPRNSTKVESCSPNIDEPSPIPKITTNQLSYSPYKYGVTFSSLPSHTQCFPGEVTGYFVT